MSTTREKLVAQARSWIGCKESDGTHRKIIDVYNADKPLPRGYKMSYTNPWCATFVTACAIKCGATDIIPKECSCKKMIELFKKLGCWVENDSHIPSPGDILFYDWDDNGKGDNKGEVEHVGIVETVSGNTVTIIEGNYGTTKDCKRRTLKVNGRYIRGYGVPKYEADPAPVVAKVSISLPILRKGSKGAAVKALQALLNGYGFTDANEKALALDGNFGTATLYALKAYQTAKGLEVDGYCGKQTWASLLT
ncbi:MAG: peptidoglycan-binding protein [Clostridia bacterium]|nr:peptidoglycan-binding protein [Clostridia bacterium]